MSNLNYKQVANVERRTWDVETYEKKAAARQQRDASDSRDDLKANGDATAAAVDAQDSKEEFRPAPAGAAGPEGSQRAFLQARKEKVSDIDERVGETTMISVEAAASASTLKNEAAVKKTGVGWHCTVCDCFLKDNLTYLDHINGRKHQRKLGYSMRVERSTESDLLTKLDELQKSTAKSQDDKEAIITFDQLVKEKDEQEQQRKEERQRKRKERKKLQKALERGESTNAVEAQNDADEPPENPDDAALDDENDGIDPAMAAMMGFSGFGGGNKSR
jgi:U4/U6.U5 tri-snRNP component SNU23